MCCFYSFDTKLRFLETGHLETCTCQLATCVGIGFHGLGMEAPSSRQAALLPFPAIKLEKGFSIIFVDKYSILPKHYDNRIPFYPGSIL